VRYPKPTKHIARYYPSAINEHQVYLGVKLAVTRHTERHQVFHLVILVCGLSRSIKVVHDQFLVVFGPLRRVAFLPAGPTGKFVAL